MFQNTALVSAFLNSYFHKENNLTFKFRQNHP